MTVLPEMKSVSNSAITQRDVLFGRGTRCACHVGSIAFKAIVVSRLESYLESKSQDAKTRVTTNLLKSVQLSGGRFLAIVEQKRGKDASDSWHEDNASWYEVDGKEARIKVRDTLRDCLKSVREKGSPSALLDQTRLSGIFGRTSTFTQILEYVSESSNIQSYVSNRIRSMEGRKRRWSPRKNFKHATISALNNNPIRSDAEPVDSYPSTAPNQDRACHPILRINTQHSTFPAPVLVSTSGCVAVTTDTDCLPGEQTTNSLSTMRYNHSTTNTISTQENQPIQAVWTPAVTMEKHIPQPTEKERESIFQKEEQQISSQTVGRQETFAPTSMYIEPLASSIYSSRSKVPLSVVQCPWNKCGDSIIQDGPISSFVNYKSESSIKDDKCYSRLPPFPRPSLKEIILKIDDEESVTSKMIDKAIALSHEEEDDALLDYCFAHTTALLIRNRNRRSQGMERCRLCNQLHDANLWGIDEEDLFLV